MQYRVRTRKRSALTAEVGYAKPPLESRWKPGQSGNPGGRPKKKLEVHSLLEKTLRKTISITRDGRRQRMTQLAALLETTLVDALKGDNTARKMMFSENARRELAAAMREDAELKENPGELDPEDQEILDAFRREILKASNKKPNDRGAK